MKTRMKNGGSKGQRVLLALSAAWLLAGRGAEAVTATQTISVTQPTETISGTGSATLSLPTGTESATMSTSVSLPTSTSTVTMSLPTGTESVSISESESLTESVSMSLFTGTVTASLITGTDTMTMSLPTGTVTASLITGTDTMTMSLPTGTSSMTLSLPTGTVSMTGTTSYTEQTGTGSETQSTSQSLATRTVSYSLPTGTASETMTMPTGTESMSVSLSLPTSTVTMSLPTTTSTATMSLPTGTESASTSLSLPTGTESMSHTISKSLSATFSLPALNNYTMTVEPASFVEGQEIRVQLKTILDGLAMNSSTERMQHDKKLFNVTDLGSLQVRMYTWQSAYAANCEMYKGTTPLAERNEFGMTQSARYEGLEFVQAAHVTFPAPSSSTQFVICFKHRLPQYDYHLPTVPDKMNDVWQVFSSGSGQYVFQASASSAWYYLPDATVGQYAIIQLLSQEASWNFTYAPSGCLSDKAKCGWGDNLKLVPQGAACTYEYQSFEHAYLGSLFVNNDGSWIGGGQDGLLEGATAGGVGAFGTQFANPLVDTWSSWGTYFPANDENYQGTSVVTAPSGGETSHAYAYVRLPQTIGQFDVCFSSRQQRVAWRGDNSSIDSVPMWRKLFRCTSPAACASNDVNTYFTTAAEEVGWSMFDLSANTWGEVVFDDSGRGQLSNMAATSTVIVSSPLSTAAYPQVQTTTANYWAPAGGDYFRIVPSASFGETTTAPRVSPFTSGTRLGSFPSVGCWSRALDVASSSASPSYHGGYVDDGARYPVGSRDLTGDPTLASPTNDAGGQSETYATLYVPNELTSWHVCYRRTCTFSGATCAQNSGMRVLPFHHVGLGSTPVKWRHLEANYPHTHVLAPGRYNESTVEGRVGDNSYPPLVTWYMNDTRTGTWGPLVVERVSPTQNKMMLDSRAWDFVRDWTLVQGDTVAGTHGSTLRLVAYDKPCDYPGFTGHPSHGAKSEDGGMVECNSAWAEASMAGEQWNCMGSAASLASVANMAFYVTVPEVANYRVCYRLGPWNWREVAPSGYREAWNDVRNPMPGSSLRRDNWVQPASWFTPTSGALSHLSLQLAEQRSGFEALFIVSDSEGSLTAAGRTAGPGENSGDVLRLVPYGTNCDINPNQWDPLLADTHLSLYCESVGSGATTTSGLYYSSSAVTPCALAKPTTMMCSGTCASDNARLTHLVKKTPDMYDDIVAHDHVYFGSAKLAATVTVPNYNTVDAAKNFYTICYKQMGTANWAIFNETWEVKQAPAMTMEPVARSVKLVGGEFQKFKLTLSNEKLPVNSAGTMAHVGFYAKLVPEKPMQDNNNCLNEPGDTEGEHFAAATTKAIFISGGQNNSMYFHMTVPQASGRYVLCVQLRRVAQDSMSWWRPGGSTRYDYDVLDNGLRWYTEAGAQPTNNGLSSVKLVRCSALEDGTCSYASNQETYNTDPGADAAKVIDVTSPCSTGGSEVSPWGASTHVGVEGGGVKGVTNLGPADGPADVAEMRVTLPGTTNDAQKQYKVCVWTLINHDGISGAGFPRWVEVAQARGMAGQVLITDGSETSSFYTAKGLMSSWTLNSGLYPAKSLFTGPSADAVGLAGASTRYVANPSTASSSTSPTVATAFTFNSYANLVTAQKSGNYFKLVRASGPSTRYPKGATWGSAGGWAQTAGADCMGPAVATASNIESCTDPDGSSDVTDGSAVCPKLVDVAASTTTSQVEAVFHVPMTPGKYLVCYKVAHSSITTENPWLWLPSSGTGSYALYSHPAFLEMEVASTKSNVTVLDMRSMDSVAGDGSQVSLSSWCAQPPQTTGEGVACSLQNNAGFTADLITVVNDTQVCPAPTVAPGGGTASAGGPGPRWFELVRTTNVSAGVSVTWTATADAFAVPPASYPSTSGQYKLCVYKAGEAKAPFFGDGASEYVTKQGVVYQLYNRGEAGTGGGSGYWRDPEGSGVPAQLLVTSTLAYNSSTRFMEYASNLETLYGSAVVSTDLVTDPLTATVSRTPLLRSGTTVEYNVQVATADGVAIPLGSYPVDVMRCTRATTFADLECPTASQTGPEVSPGEFIVKNVDGACTEMNGPMYGWYANGLRQFTVSGVVKFALQYRSACPSGEFGCGVRFVGTADVNGVSTSLMSAAQWVNVDTHPPLSVAIDGQEVNAMAAPAVSVCSAVNEPRCYLKTCHHMQPCKLTFQARWQGPSEFSPNGTVSLIYAEADYVGFNAANIPAEVNTALGSTVGTALIVDRGSWSLGGYYTHTFVPNLKTGSEATVYLNLTFGENAATDWTRFVVKVMKPVPKSVAIKAVWPVDVAGGYAASRSPAPAFIARSMQDTATGVSLQAADGVYIEALVPYHLSYEPRDANGMRVAMVSGSLTGWTVTASIDESSSSKVLGAAPAGTALITEPQALLSQALNAAADGTTFSLTFRAYVVDGMCSRFVTKAGCTLTFSFSHATESTITMGLRTPVRIPASTIRITAASTSATVREGLRVVARPGTWVVSPQNVDTFVDDDFHHADVFALLNSPTPTDGATNRDHVRMMGDMTGTSMLVTGTCAYADDDSTTAAVECAVEKYRTQDLSTLSGLGLTGWGATWTMRPNKPCRDCEFTFHSTLGAGPESYETGRLANMRGFETLTWTSEEIQLACAVVPAPASGSNAVVYFTEGASASNTFTVAATAESKAAAGSSAYYPRWWVFTDTASDVTAGAYTLMQDGATGTVLSERMERGVATFSKLSFTGALPPTDVATLTTTFRTVGLEYSATEAGSVPSATKEYSCSVDVDLTFQAAATPTSYMELVGVNGATAMCGTTATECLDWQTTVDTFTAGITVEVAVKLMSNGVSQKDTTTQNVTVVPLGGYSTSPKGVAPTWTASGSTLTSADITLDSAYNTAGTLYTDGTYSYTYGTMAVLAERTVSGVNSSVLTDGAGSVKLMYGQTGATTVDKSPVRESVFQVCTSAWDGSAEVTGSLCKTVRLWVLPSTTPTQQLVIVSEPGAGGKVRGTGPACGSSPTLLSVQAFAYYSAAGVTSTSSLRFFVYDADIEYSLTMGSSQQLVMSGSAELNTTLYVRNGVTAVSDKLRHTLTRTGGLQATFSFYGANVLTTAKALSVAGMAGSSSLSSVSTTNTYTWADPTETFAVWSLEGAVSMDSECPSKRRLQTTTHNYRTYGSAAPGAGWAYETQAAAVGQPFPVETVVKTTAGTRAWSFTSGTMVKVSKRGWSKCNDGGALTVYELNPSAAADTVALREGTLSRSWSSTTSPMVATDRGVGTAWVVLGAECEACTLQLDLCYTGKTTAATCSEGLGVGSTDPSDAAPIFSDRTKVTKPFSVRKAKVDLVDVYAQTTPATSTESSMWKKEIYVGDMFSVEVQNVQVFGAQESKWALNEVSGSTWTRTVSVRSVWRPAAGDVGRSREMRYGNGGFMVDGVARSAAASGCSAALTAAEYESASSMPAALSGASSGSLSFFFARPCQSCEVWLDYQLTPPTGTGGMGLEGMGRQGSFPLRMYTAAAGTLPSVGSPLVYAVRTCGSSWLLGSVPQVAVRRRMAFSVTALRVNAHNEPSWDSTAATTLSLSTSSGNGGGGRAVLTSPTAASSDSAVQAQEGSATARLFLTRACYHCVLTFAGVRHHFTVLTDPTQIIAIPSFPMKDEVQWLKEDGNVGEWTYEVYAADDLGDRSYVVGGPTPFAFQPMYSTYNTGGGSRVSKSLSLGTPSAATTSSVIFTDPAGSLSLSTLTIGTPTSYTVSNGSLVHNGIPVPSLANELGEVGTATVKLAGTVPTLDFPVKFTMNGAAASAPATYWGEKREPMVSWSLVSDRIAVDDPASGTDGGCVSTGTVQGAGPCMFRVYTIARSPVATSADTTWYHTISRVEGNATATVTCGTCGAAEVTPAGGAPFMGGVAMMSLKLVELTTTTTCKCTVTVTPPTTLVNATEQTFEVSYDPAPTAPTQTLTSDVWDWDSSSTLMVANGATDSSLNRTVALRLRAWDSTKTASGLGGITWAATEVTFDSTMMSPAGCFKCSVNPTATTCSVTVENTGGDLISIEGYFSSETTEQTCTIGADTFSELPTAAGTVTTNPNALVASLKSMHKVMVVLTTPEVLELQGPTGALEKGLNFSHLTGMLGDEPSAVVGEGVLLTLMVMNESGVHVTGDYHTEITLNGVRDGNHSLMEVTKWPELTKTVKGGMVQFWLDSNITTYIPDCEDGVEDCHAPWIFNITASAPNAGLGDFDVPAPVYNVGPLYFIRRASMLVAVADIGPEWPDVCEEMPEEDMDMDMGPGTNSSGGEEKEKKYLECTPIGMHPGTGSMKLDKLVMDGYIPLNIMSAGMGMGMDMGTGTDTEGMMPGIPAGLTPQGPGQDWRPAADADFGQGTGQKEENGLGRDLKDEEWMTWVEMNVLPRMASWGNGYSFEIKIYAVDWMGEVVEDPGDIGGEAKLLFRPLAVPCLNVDASSSSKWVMDTCVDGGGTCNTDRSISALPQCSQKLSGWSLDSEELELKHGEAELGEIKFSSSHTATSVQRFMLTTTNNFEKQMMGEGGNPYSAMGGTFLYEIAMQVPHMLVPLMMGTTCDEKAKTCTVTEVAEPGVRLDFPIGILDTWGELVLSASSANITVTGVCEDEDTNSFFAVVTESGDYDYFTTPVLRVEHGMAYVEDVAATAVCQKMTLTFTCVAGEDDTRGLCNGIVSTASFAVALPANSTAAPVVPLEPVQAELEMGTMDASTFESLDTSYAATFQTKMLTMLKERSGIKVVKKVILEFICNVISGAQITDADRADPSICHDFLATATPTTAPMNSTDNTTVAMWREAEELQTTLVAKAQFQIEPAVSVDTAQLANTVTSSINNDLNTSNSFLKSGSGSVFSGATQVVVTPPSTPAPTLVPTLEPPTLVPPTAVPTAVPTPVPPPVPVAPVPIEGGVPTDVVPLAAHAAGPSLLSLAVATLVAALMLV